MRFSAPRSISPSPQKRRHASSFGLNSSESESESSADDDDDESVPDSGSDSDSDSDSFCYASESEVPLAPLKPEKTLSRPSHVEDTIAAIRLRTRHHDPYEEWEREMKKESLRAARQSYTESQAKLNLHKNQRQLEDSRRLAAAFKQDSMQITKTLNSFRLDQQAYENRLKEKLIERNDNLWGRIEASIKLEQDKVQARLDEERRVAEEAERKRREEEEKKRLEEKRRMEEEERRIRDEEEKKRKLEEEARILREEKEATVREAKEREERLKSEAESRKAAGMTMAEDDWKEARRNLHITKTQGTRFVKANPSFKPKWSDGRRSIRAKIGQLTNDDATINRVSSQLISILLPVNGTLPPPVYTALLSTLAKALILQAETEITAEKRSAIPLAQITFNCLEQLEGFPEVLFAKMTQRIGSWAIPCPIPETDFDGTGWANDAQIRKVQGYRTGEDGVMETQNEYTDRVKGVMRLYFEILRILPRKEPLKRMFALPRYWTWMARMLGSRTLLATPVGAEVLFIALDVLGTDALQIWGYQFVKMLNLIYDGATEGLGSAQGKLQLLGGLSPDGIAARARVKLEVESIISPAERKGVLKNFDYPYKDNQKIT